MHCLKGAQQENDTDRPSQRLGHMPRAPGNDGSHPDKSHVKIRPITLTKVHQTEIRGAQGLHQQGFAVTHGRLQHCRLWLTLCTTDLLHTDQAIQLPHTDKHHLLWHLTNSLSHPILLHSLLACPLIPFSFFMSQFKTPHLWLTQLAAL